MHRHRTPAVRLFAPFIALIAAAGCGDAQSPPAAAQANGATPTKEIVEKALKASWDHPDATPKVSLTLNSVKFGTPYKATAQEVQVEGVPDGATVTPAVVDFTVRTYYDRETQALKRVREATVYVDKMGEWTVMTGSPKGDDVTTMEPLATPK